MSLEGHFFVQNFYSDRRKMTEKKVQAKIFRFLQKLAQLEQSTWMQFLQQAAF